MAKRDKPGMKSVEEVTAEREKKQREKYRAEQAARDAAARLAGAAGRVYGAANKVAGVKTATDPITEAQRTTAAKMRQQAGNMAMHAKWADRARQTGSTGLYNEAAANYNRALDQLQQTQAAHRQRMAPALPAGNQALLTAPRYIPGALETSIPLNQRAASYAQGEANLALGAGDAAGYADAMRRYNAAMDNIRDTVLHEGARMDARVADARQRASAAEEAETAQTGRVMSSGKYDMRPYYMGGGQSSGETGIKVDPTLHEQTERANARLYALQERQRQTASDVDAYRWGKEEQRIRTDPDLARKAELGRQRWEQERSRRQENADSQKRLRDWTVGSNQGGSWYTNNAIYLANTKNANQGMVDTMTPEHQQIYWALYSENPERAQQYADYVGKLDTDAWYADIAEAAGRDPASRMGAFIGGTVSNLASGMDPWGESGQAASRMGEALIGGGGQGLQERGIFNTGKLAGTTPEDWPIIGGKGLADWYQLESSIAQSAMTAAMTSAMGGGTFAELGTLALMGGSAAASDYRDMLNKGADERTALLHSAAYGINEALFEKLSLENLINADMVKPVLVTLLQSSGVEGSEEMFTSIANAIADAATAKLSGGAYQSDIDRETYRLMLGGMSAADAREQASRNMAFDIIYDGLGGAISGGLSVGGKLGLMAANNAIQNRVATNVGNRLTGMALAGSRETMAAVQQYANDNGIRFEGKVDTATDTRAAEDVAGEAMEAAEAAGTEEGENAKPTRQERREQRQQERADRRLGESYQRVQRHVQQQLERAGSKAETMEIYNSLEAQYGEDFTRAVLAPSLEAAQAKVYAKAKSLDELKQLHQANVQGETDAAFVSAAEDAYEARARELAPSREEYTRARRSAAYANRQGQEIDLTVRTEDGGAQQRTEVLRIDDAGRAVLADGSTHEIRDLDMDLDTKDLLATLTSRVQGEDANTILATVQDALRSGRIDNAYRALSAAITVYGQGQLGTISQTKAVAQSGLNAELATKLYQQGAQSHAEGVQQAQARRDTQLAEARERGAEAVNPAQEVPGTKRQAKRVGATGRRGSVDTSRIAGMQLSRTQQRQVGLATRIAQALGVDVEFFASTAGEDGLYSGEQGSYKDGRIRLDINAGLTQATELMQTSILNTMSHELTHYIQDYSPALYDELRQAVLDRLTGEYGEDWVQERIQEKFDRATDRISQEEAIDEVVADGCELMLRDSEAIRELYQSNRTLFDRIADWISRFLRRIREEFTGAQTREGQAMEKYLSELQGLWDKALVDAAQVQGQVQAERDTKNTAREGGEERVSLRPDAELESENITSGRRTENRDVRVSPGTRGSDRQGDINGGEENWRSGQRNLLDEKEIYQQRDYGRLGDEEVIARMAPESIENRETRKIVGEYKQLAKDRRALQQTLREAKASEAALVASGGSLTESQKMQRDLQRRIDRLGDRMRKKLGIGLVQQLIAEERSKAVKDAKAHKDEVFANYKERRKATELRGRIANLRQDLVQRVLRPTDGRYVPAELGGALVDMLDTLDMRPGDGTQAAAKYDRITDALHAMRDAYAGLESNDDPTWRTEYDTEMAKELKDLQERIGDRDVRSLNVSELQAVYDAVRRIRDTLRSATKLLAHNSTATIYDRAESIVAQMRQATPDNAITPAQRRERTNRLQKLSAMRAVLYMSGSNRDSTLYKMFRDIEDGYTDSMTWVMDYNKRFTGLRTGANERTWRRATTEQQSYGLKDSSGKDVKMTRMQVMQLIMTWEREMHNDTLTHLQTGGASIRDAAAIANGKAPTSQRVRLDQETIDRLAGTLTQWERDYIAQIRDYFRNTEAPAMGRVVYALKHRALQTEDYYVPYTVDGGYLESKIGEDNALDGIWVRNPRSTQPLQNMAPQPVIIDGIDTVMKKHVSDSGNYVSLALPIRDFAKVYNARFANADGVATMTHTAVEEAYGSEGDKLIKSIIAEVQGQRNGNSVTTWMDQAVGKLQSSFVRAALLINPSVTIKQAASYLAAGSVISRKALELGNRPALAKTDQGHSIGLIEHLFVSPNGKVAQKLYEEMDRYTSIGWERRVGLNMEDNMSKNALMRKVQENISGWEESKAGHYGRKALAVVNALNWIQRMDVATTTALWVACKEQARLDGLAVGSEEYWAHTTELYERAVRETQPMYDPLHRSQQQKNSKGLIPYLFQFRTVPMQNHGQLVDAMEEWRAAKGTSREKESRQFFIKTVVANFESAVMFSALSFLAAALKHKTGRYRDKDDEMSVGSVLTGIGLDTASVWASNLMPLMGSEIYNMIEAAVTSLISGKLTTGNYDALSVGVVDMVNDLISAGEKLWKYSVEGIHGNPASWDEWRDALWRFGKNTAKACGIPAQTMETYIKGFVANVQDIANGRFPALNNVSVERTLSTNARRYYDAWADGDDAKMDAVLDEIRQGYLSNGKDEAKADELTRNGISSYAIEQYKAGEMSLEDLRELLDGTGLYDTDKLNTKIKGLLREELDAGARDEDGTIRSLVSLAGMDEDAAWDTVRKWSDTAAHGEDEDYSWGKYDEVHAAIDANRDIDQIVAELVNHGYDEKNVRNDAKRYITEQYEAGAYSEEKMRNYLSRYCGIVKREQVDEIVNNSKCYIDTGYHYKDLREAYEDSSMAAPAVEQALQRYGGLSSAEAKSRVRYWRFQADYEESDLTEDQVSKYYDTAPDGVGRTMQQAGIKETTWIDYCQRLRDCKGTDADGDGKTDSGSKKAAIMQMINALPLTAAQKDALYYLNGWSKKTISDAPWR